MMTAEQRLDRLERNARLMTHAGLRWRRQMREQNDKIDIIIDGQMKFSEAQMKNEERFAKLAESQSHTDRQLDTLIDIIRQGRNGKSN
jgi:hypothetical protein